MFGMGKQRKGPTFVPWEFDMEKDLKNLAAARKQKELIEERIQTLKTLLRKGEEKKDFDATQTLLHGFLAAQKVIGRIGRKF